MPPLPAPAERNVMKDASCTLEHDNETGMFRIEMSGDSMKIAHLLACALYRLYHNQACDSAKALVGMMFSETYQTLEKEGGLNGKTETPAGSSQSE